MIHAKEKDKVGSGSRKWEGGREEVWGNVEKKVTFELRRKEYEEWASLPFILLGEYSRQKQQGQRPEAGMRHLRRGGQT